MIDAQLEEEAYLADPSPRRRVVAPSVLRDPVSVLDRNEPICVAPETPVSRAVDLMLKQRVGCVLVEDGGALVGIFTERDVLLKTLRSGIDPARTPVSQLMTSPPRTVSVDAPIAEALRKMSRGGFRHLPVLDRDRKPVSVLSVRDVVDLITDYFSTAVLTMPPEPGLDVPRSREGA